MWYVMAAPEMMAAAATDVAVIGSTLSAAHMTAAAPTVAVIPAAADQVSTSIASLFSRVAQDYQALAGQAAAFNEQFVHHLNTSSASYAAAEAVNVASLLQPLDGAVGSSVSAIAALLDQILNTATSLWNMITSQLTAFVNLLQTVAGLAYIATYVVLVLNALALFFGIILIDFVLAFKFGIFIPISLPY